MNRKQKHYMLYSTFNSQYDGISFIWFTFNAVFSYSSPSSFSSYYILFSKAIRVLLVPGGGFFWFLGLVGKMQLEGKLVCTLLRAIFDFRIQQCLFYRLSVCVCVYACIQFVCMYVIQSYICFCFLFFFLVVDCRKFAAICINTIHHYYILMLLYLFKKKNNEKVENCTKFLFISLTLSSVSSPFSSSATLY